MDIVSSARKPGFRKALVVVAVVIVVYAGLGFLALPSILKLQLERRLSAPLHRPVSVQKVRANPFMLSVTIDGLAIGDREGAGEFVSLDRLYANFQLASLFRMAPVVREVTLRGPKVTIVRNEDLTYNFSDLLAPPSPAPAPAEPSKPLRYSFNNIRVEGGNLDFDDRPTKKRHTVRDLALAIPFVSNLSYALDEYVEPSFEAKFNGTPLVSKGKSKPFKDSRESVFELSLDDLDIPYYLEYLPLETKAKIVSGRFSTKASVSFVRRQRSVSALVVSGRAKVTNLAIEDESGAPLLTLPGVEVVLAAFDVFGGKARVESLRLDAPEVHPRLATDRSLNLTALVPPGETKTAFELEVDEARVAGGRVFLADETVAPTFTATLDPVDATIRHFSTAPSKAAAVEASLRSDAGESISHSGSVTLDPLSAEGTLEVKGVPLKRYAPYYASSVAVAVEDGVLDVSARYRYAAEGFSISGLGAKLVSLRLREKGRPRDDLLRVQEAAVEDASVDVAKRAVAIGRFSSSGGRLFLRREPIPAGAAAPEPAPGEPAAAATTAAVEAGWSVEVAKVALDRYAMKWDDTTTGQPVSIVSDGISLAAENLSTAEGSRGSGSLKLKIGPSGTLSANGSVGLTPVFASVALDARGIDLVPLQPYVESVLHLDMTSGAASAKGKLDLAPGPAGAIRAVYSGTASVTKLATTDLANGEDFLKWESLYLSGIEAATEPFAVRIAEAALTDFYSRVAVYPDGTLNLQRITGAEAVPPSAGEGEEGVEETEAPPAEPVAPPPASPASPPPPISIDRVTLQGGTINFSDNFVKPNYVANLTEIGGRISGLSSEASTTADVDLKGKLDHQAPLDITGKINPLRGNLFADIKGAVRDIEMSSFSPYSGKYAGYSIEKGKLAMDVSYRIEDGKLDATNKLFLDQFTFGQKVESEDATSLPVRLAVSLLKDRNGEIHLDIPVKGSLDDPRFSVWRVVWKIVRNLLVKVATSPFALFKALGGGGEELSYLEFAEGRAALDAGATSKIESLEKALYDRPALKLEITGHADPEKDREGLRRLLFERKVKTQKLAYLVKQGAPPVPVDDVAIAPEEYADYLAKAYKKEKFPKPRNFVGIAKELPAPEMEKLMLTHIEVGESDLRQLAMQRAQAAKDALLAPGRVEPERIFLLEPKTLAPEKNAKLSDSRVDFVIR